MTAHVVRDAADVAACEVRPVARWPGLGVAVLPDATCHVERWWIRHNGDVTALDTLHALDEELGAFCRRHGIRHLAVFGSALRDELRPDSDLDLLVEFEPGQVPGLLGLARLELELEPLLGREVELRTYADLSERFRDEVRRQAEDLYVA